MRRAARLLNVHRITIARKLSFLASQARLSQQHFLQSLQHQKLFILQFDDMETFEHTKYKPLSITMAVTRERKVIGLEVSKMPAKGLLAARAIEKYGRRYDDRKRALRKLLENLKPIVCDTALFQSDQNPHYPGALKRVFPNCRHETTKGRRGCIVGQGELKKIDWDPLFSFNHTAAMFRANVNRLFRRTWCTTKKAQSLKDHLDLYVDFHNQVLTA